MSCEVRRHIGIVLAPAAPCPADWLKITGGSVFLSQQPIFEETSVTLGNVAMPHLMLGRHGTPTVLAAPGVTEFDELLKIRRRRQAYYTLSLRPAFDSSVILCLVLLAVASGTQCAMILIILLSLDISLSTLPLLRQLR